MKRIELYEEGFFFTFLIEGKDAYIAAAPIAAPYNDLQSEAVLLPTLEKSSDRVFEFCDYEDTGNQIGRIITLMFRRIEDGRSAFVSIQFVRGCRRADISVGWSDSSVKTDIKAFSFRYVFEKYADCVSFTVREDGAESLILK